MKMNRAEDMKKERNECFKILTGTGTEAKKKNFFFSVSCGVGEEPSWGHRCLNASFKL
jgi:hypothetical protein